MAWWRAASARAAARRCPHWSDASGDDDAHGALDVLIQAELVRRAQARAEKDWATADQVRDRLVEAGIEVTDTPDGARWALKSKEH